ncbi:MAG: DMT family transporter [Gemmatimonadetes bacterium]|nr:DMT family transporter [Gemmatimonadota bacterium]MCA9768818.1 DMT family transporter [Gemmatimonadota bacterium]MCB9519042.1 DMT family transporter [Gemmatimonadales bacterium]HPF61169.1 DMT family transporter [Gemmatimonadales bacterium]HRX19635.1 DMT family transporter [Gemmatimonadales bacterium]
MSRPTLSPATGMLIVTLLWGGNFTATKIAFLEIGPLAFTALRFALATLVLWWILGRVEGRQPLPPGALGRLVVLGLVGQSGYQLLFIEGLARTSATKSAIILSTLPIAVTVGAALLRIEVVTARQRWAVIVATLGVAAVLAARGGSIGGPVGRGDLLLFGAVIAWTAYTLLLRRWALPMSTLALTAWTLYTGTPVLVLTGLPQLWATDWGAITLKGWGGTLYASLLSLVAAYLLWNRGVARLGAARAAVYNTLVPFVAAVLAFLFLHEVPGPLHILGGMLIIVGILLARQAPAPEG